MNDIVKKNATNTPDSAALLNFRVPVGHQFLTDEQVIDQLQFIRDKALAVVAERFLVSAPALKGSLAYLEVVNRCHRDLEAVYRLQKLKKLAEDGDGLVFPFF